MVLTIFTLTTGGIMTIVNYRSIQLVDAILLTVINPKTEITIAII